MDNTILVIILAIVILLQSLGIVALSVVIQIKSRGVDNLDKFLNREG